MPEPTISTPNRVRRGVRSSFGGGLFERLFGLDGETNRDVGLAVEHLDQMTAQQAVELALGPPLGNQLNAAVAGIALGTADIRFPHAREYAPRISGLPVGDAPQPPFPNVS